MKSINDKIRLEDFAVHELKNPKITVLSLRFNDLDEVPIFSESVFEMIPDSKQPGKLREKNTGRKVQDGKININVYSGSLSNERFEYIEKLNLKHLLPSASEFQEAQRDAPYQNSDPIVYHTFSVSPGEWDGLMEDLLRIKLIPL